MLSFQKDDHTSLIANNTSAPEGAPQDAVTRQDDYLTVSSHGKKLQQSTMILVALFAVGALGVWFMIKKTVPATANAAPGADQAQLEAALAQLNSMQQEMNSEMDSVVGRFHDFGKVDQVGVNDLKKNPFQREVAGIQEEIIAESDAQKERQQLQAAATQKASKMELWSITSTPKGLSCMINNKLLYKGDVIDDMTIQTINNKSVILDYKGVPVELKISE